MGWMSMVCDGQWAPVSLLRVSAKDEEMSKPEGFGLGSGTIQGCGF